MLLQRPKSPESPYKSQVLDCITCDLQQAEGHKNWYCYQCDQLYFAEAPPCPSPMSRRLSGRKRFLDDESLKSPKQEPSQLQHVPKMSTFNPNQEQSGQNSGNVQHHTSLGYELPEAGRSSGFVPFAYNHGITIPSVDRFEPSEGSATIPVTVYLRSRRDLSFNPGPGLAVIFGTQRMQSQLYSTGYHNGEFFYSLVFLTPWFIIQYSPMPIPLYLTVSDATQNTVPPTHFGYFAYHAPVGTLGVPPVEEPPALRRTSSASALASASPDNRMIQATSSMQPGRFHPMHSQDLPTSSPATQYSMLQAPTELITPSHYSPTVNTGLGSQYEPMPEASGSVSMVKTEDTSEPHWSTYRAGNVIHPPTINVATPRVQAGTNTGKAQNIGPGSLASESSVKPRAAGLKKAMSHSRLNIENAAQHFNPYSIPKATLQIQGDLNDMLQNWTDEENETRRRLVAFERSQRGNTIHATFRAIPIADWDPEGICVSCIWWQEKNEAFITSVDLISLLESMVGLRFTLQEKNRIRRNLEGFKPYTIGKSKPDKDPLPSDVEEFFKVIMGLGEPKPRSIEKDVKVFPWKSLATAMKKVVDKYSASYASTAGTLHPSSSLARSEGEESSRRPSASQSEGASSSADPDF